MIHSIFGSERKHSCDWLSLNPMTVLCSALVSESLAVSLKENSENDEVLWEKAEAIEVMKEVVTQINITELYTEQLATLNFVQTCLVSVRALLLGQECRPWKLLSAPLPRMADLESGAMWEIKHPDRERFHDEVIASIAFMEGHAMTAHGEPWQWLLRFLQILDYNLV